MSSRRLLRPEALARYAFCAFAALVAAALALVTTIRLTPHYRSADSWSSVSVELAMTLSFAVVGAILTLKRPSNLVGWALLLAGNGLLLGGVLDAYAELALLARPGLGLPGGAAAAALATGLWTALMAGVFLLLVTFPTGRLASRRIRRWTLLVLAGFTVVWLVIATAPGSLDPPYDGFDNPLAFVESKAYVAVIVPIIAGCLLSIVTAGIRAVLAFRRSRGLEREQYKWLAASATLLVVLLPVSSAFNWSAVAGAAFTVALTALPVSVGIAVLRYRLFEIDRIVSRTLTYGVVSVFLIGVYAGLVLAGQAAFSSFAGGGNLVIAFSTLVVAALFLPVRGRTQRLVERRFNRHRYDAQRTLEAFGARLRENVELDGLAAELGGIVGETMQPTHVGVWLRSSS